MIGIIGNGVVGGCLIRYFKDQGRALVVYDKFKGEGSLAAVNQGCHTVFVCVPTPFGAQGGVTGLDALYESLAGLENGKQVVVKSTVPPGTCNTLQRDFPRHSVLHNPEFLVERQAYQDFIHPTLQLVGYTSSEQESQAREVLLLLPPAPVSLTLFCVNSEMVKLALNSYLAMKVIFGNQIYDLSEAVGADYALVARLLQEDTRVGPSHLDVWQDGYRGWGGKCLPKDLSALLGLAGTLGVDLPLLQQVQQINLGLRGLSV